MRKTVWWLLLASQVFASCAFLAGLAAGFLDATIIAGLTCFDNCPTADHYFSNLGLSTAWLMSPCIALESLALAAFLAYCLTTGQARRAVTPILFALVGGLVGVAALGALMLQGQASLPLTPEGVLVESAVTQWAFLWGITLMVVAVVWSAILGYLQWIAM